MTSHMEEATTQSPADAAGRLRVMAEALVDGEIIMDGTTYTVPDNVHFHIQLDEATGEDAGYELEMEIRWPVPFAARTDAGAGYGEDGEVTLYYEAEIASREAAANHLRELASKLWGEQFKLGERSVNLPPQIDLTIEVETEDGAAGAADVTKLEIEIGWSTWEMMPASGFTPPLVEA
ncbi:MAG: amphi-Trp domain-containing protein, partial [Anaerolineae bacterium]|nr:amphi-Trp domain-containing protein [Anaerolineae bacterium]